jgi:hypothetical protein
MANPSFTFIYARKNATFLLFPSFSGRTAK